jgi:hypothetical protein
MNRQTDIDKRVNKALESLEGIQRAELTPYFFTRLKARLEREQHNYNIWEATGSFMARPAIAFVGLLFILCVNAFILFNKDTTATDQSSGVVLNTTMPVEEYVLTAATSNYDYENLEP